ncbi:MAG: response regulator [Syntrophaceae bacterium]
MDSNSKHQDPGPRQKRETLAILVVDDEQDFLDSIRRGLISCGFKKLHSESDPVKAASMIRDGDRFDIAIIDVLMPEMNGIELLEQIKKSQPATYCIMLTAVQDIRKVVECMQKGAADYLTKPVSLEGLLSAIERAGPLQKKEERTCLRILVLEDDASTCRLMQIFLDQIGECRIVSGGRTALDSFQSALDQGKPFDLLLLDIMVPEINGIDVLKKVRMIERSRGIHDRNRAKVIITSSLSDARNMEQARSEESDGYLVKPVNRAKLFSAIRTMGLLP